MRAGSGLLFWMEIVAPSAGFTLEGAMAGGQIRIGTGTVRYTLKNLGKETVFNAWIP